ncbi:hypothetical protein D3C76_787110 [compost metagenome]
MYFGTRDAEVLADGIHRVAVLCRVERIDADVPSRIQDLSAFEAIPFDQPCFRLLEHRRNRSEAVTALDAEGSPIPLSAEQRPVATVGRRRRTAL